MFLMAEVTSDLLDQFTLSAELFVACSIMAYSLKTLHKSSNIFVEHARHVAKIIVANPDLDSPAIAGSVVTIGLSVNANSHSKK